MHGDSEIGVKVICTRTIDTLLSITAWSRTMGINLYTGNYARTDADLSLYIDVMK